MVVQAIVSAVVLAAVALAGWRFNRYVDARPTTGRADGETSLWVIFGCAYLVLAGSLLTGVWAPWLPTDWRLGVASGVIFFSVFAAGGLPMALGDHRRSASGRRTNEALEQAVRHLQVAQQRTPAGRI